MKLSNSTLFWTFLWCIFMAITAGSIGLGAVFPSINLIAKPFVCPNGEMQLKTQNYYPSPVETVTTLTWYCVDRLSGEKKELGIFPMVLYPGALFGLIFFVIAVLVLTWRSRRNVPVDGMPRATPNRSSASAEPSNLGAQRTLVDELEYLHTLLESGQITQKEYARRAKEASRNLS